MEAIEAKEILTCITVGDFTHNMKQNDRKSLHRNLKKLASKYDKIETKSVDDLEQFLKGFMNG